MKTSRLILVGPVFLTLISALAGCQPATPAVSTPTESVAPQNTNTALPSATIAPTSTPEPTPTTVPNSFRQTDGMEMVYIPAGKFSMGTDDGEPEEEPLHDIHLDAYWIDLTEITNGMYALCVEAESCNPPLETGSYTRDTYFGNDLYADYPVIFVDWEMANAYCQWAGARLPTEAEWEKAARGDNGQIFPWGNDWDVVSRKRLNFADRKNPEMASDQSVDDGYRDTAPVGSFPAGRSPYGIHDLAGNVWEWVADWYDPLYYNETPPENPTGPVQETSLRALRGGAWVATNEIVFRTYNRNGLEPSEFSSSIGFRCAR